MPDELTERQSLGARLRKLREYLGYTQEEIAQALGLHRPAVSEVEAGRRSVSAMELRKLSALYKLPVSYLLDEPAGPTALQLVLPSLDEADRAALLTFAEFLRFRKAHRKEGEAS